MSTSAITPFARDAATSYADLAAEVAIPPDGILSQTLFASGQVKVVIFGLDAGQELSEHAAAVPAIMQVIRGEATITLGEQTIAAQAGAWAYMPARLRHSVLARTPLVMLLTLLRGEPAA